MVSLAIIHRISPQHSKYQSELNIPTIHKIIRRVLFFFFNEFTLIPNNNSGARYQSVTTIGVYAFNGEPYSLAKPKSAI